MICSCGCTESSATSYSSGLYFLAFSADPDRFDWLLQSMLGLSDDGRRDRLLGYSRPVSGSYFYASPPETLRVGLDG